MKKLIALVCCVSAAPAWAADVGLGVSAESNDSTIYVPIDFGNTWRLEPFFNWSKSKTESYGIAADFRTFRIGTGIFGMKGLGESFRIYYGGRLAYLDVEVDQYTSPFGTQRDEGDGYRVAPTLGFEYSFNEHVSLGGEAEWFYEEVDLGDQRKDERNGTDTRLILRSRF